MEPPSDAEVRDLLSEGESLVAAYAGRVNKVHGNLVTVTIVDKDGRYAQAQCDVTVFQPTRPYQEMYFLAITAQRLSAIAGHEYVNRVRVIEPYSLTMTREEHNDLLARLRRGWRAHAEYD